MKEYSHLEKTKQLPPAPSKFHCTLHWVSPAVRALCLGPQAPRAYVPWQQGLTYHIVTCRNFAVYAEVNLIQYLFSFRSRDGISIFVIPPAVSPWFLHWISGRASPNPLDLGLYPAWNAPMQGGGIRSLTGPGEIVSYLPTVSAEDFVSYVLACQPLPYWPLIITPDNALLQGHYRILNS